MTLLIFNSDCRNNFIAIPHFIVEVSCTLLARSPARGTIQPLNTQVRGRSQKNPCGIYVGKCGTRIGFLTSTPVFPFQYHTSSALYSCFTKYHPTPIGIMTTVRVEESRARFLAPVRTFLFFGRPEET